MSAELERINPPVVYAAIWWVVAVVCVLAGVVVVVAVRRLGRVALHGTVDVEALRAATVNRIETLVESSTGKDNDTRRVVAARVGAEVRQFLGTVTSTDLDYTTRQEWLVLGQRDPRLGPAVDLLVDLTHLVFPASGDADLEDVGHRAVEVVTSWR